MNTDQQERTRPPFPEEGPERHEPPKSSLSIAQVVGGALAAMTAAALGSRLSVAGTVVGAALASVVAAVGGALYTASLRRTSHHVGAVLTRVRPATPTSAPLAAPGTTDTGWTAVQPAESRLATATATPARRYRIGWKAVVGAAVLMFLVAALALTGIELATGRALSGGSGTTVGQVAQPSTRPPAKPTRSATAKPTASASSSASASAEPTAAASSTPLSQPTAEPSTSSSPAPSATPTTSPTPSVTPGSTPAVVRPGATPAS